MRGGRWWPVLAAWCLFATAGARAAPIEIGPEDDLEAAWNALAPGDELVLRGGMYVVSGRFGVSAAGTEAEPIVIRAKDGERPHVHRDGADQNLVDIDRAEYVTLRGIEFSGGSAGIRISAARFFTIEACEIHGTADVALRANDDGALYDTLRIAFNHIHHTSGTGEGMYLGCNGDACRLANSVIEGNYVHHTNGPSIEQGDGIEIKEGSYNNVVRDNVVHDTNYPCILTYSTAGNGAPNVIERNLLFRCGDHAIQSAADAIIRNNIILGAGSDGIAMQPHQAGAPDNLVVVHNTVLDADGAALSVRSATGSVLIANNALFTSGATALLLSGAQDEVTVIGNVGAGSSPGTGFTTATLEAAFAAAHFDGEPPIDLFPKAGGPLVGSGELEHVIADDFNGTPREGRADVGAYAFAASGNPGWALGSGFKEPTTELPPTAGAGAGAGGAGAGTAGGAGTRGGAGASAGRGAAGRGGGGGGMGTSDAGPARDAGATQDAGAAPDAMDGGSGCGCRTAASRSGASRTGAVAIAVLVLAARVRLRRARQAQR
jgi:hypothetical protein